MFKISKNINIFGGEHDEILFTHILSEHNDGDICPDTPADAENVSAEAGEQPISAFHSHDFCELLVYIKGDVGYIVEDTYHIMKRGDMLLLRPNEIHKVVFLRPTQYERFVINFPVSCFDNMRGGITSPLEFVMDRKSGERNILRPSDDTLAELTQQLYDISALVTSSRQGWELAAYSRLIRLLDIIGCGIRENFFIGRGNALPPLPDKILTYVNEHYSDITTAESIARVFGISPSYLSRIFKKSMDITLNQYIQAKRIARAKTLLSSGSSVAQACFGCGFNDCSHFITVFKKLVGTTPYKYKAAPHNM
ncbi:MAG: AraC family transcriptional regulator [Eubacteriales bacterium]